VCLTGSGVVRISSSESKSLFRFDSMSKKGKWLIGVQFPIVGEKILEFSPRSSKKSILLIRQLFQGTEQVNWSVFQDVFALIVKFHHLARIGQFPTKGISLNEISLNLKSHEVKNEKRYALELVHEGLIFDTKVSSLEFDYQSCSESK